MLFTFNDVANSMERELWIKDELRFDEGKSLVIFGATSIKYYPNVCLVVK